jgi:hypothetical protein
MKTTSDRDWVYPSDHGKSCIMARVGGDGRRFGELEPGHIQSRKRIERFGLTRIGETTQSNGHQLGIGRRSVSYACWAVFCFMFSRTSADPDLWGHVRFGQDLWQTGRIVREDIYS